MVFSRGLVISLGVSALSATLLFLYFRNRMASVERKVDVMFDLIQSHENDRQQMVQKQMMMAHQTAPTSQNTGAWVNEDNNPERNLIDVSEDDEEYDSEDSREVSDDEEDLEERRKLVTTEVDLDEAEEAKSVVVLEANSNEPVDIDETVELQEVTDDIDQLETSDNETTSQTANNEDETTEPVENEEDDSLEEDDSEVEEEEDEEEEDVVQEVSNTIEYKKLKVSELKAIAQAKGLTNYKSIKKQPLIDLIRASE